MYFQLIISIYCIIIQVPLSTFVSCLSSDLAQELLGTHNHYRELVASAQETYTVANMNRLVWSDMLASTAEKAVSCELVPSREIHIEGKTVRNVNIGRTGQATGNLSQVLAGWFKEKDKYLPEWGECYPWFSCKSFKNMINAKHRRIGCAVAENCGDDSDIMVLLCLYEGGTTGQFDFRNGLPCLGCSDELPFCSHNLCVACYNNTETCDCRKTCTNEGVGHGQLNSSTCICNCLYGNGPNCDQPCRNQQQYVDYDPCVLVTTEYCNDPEQGEIYRDLCPEACSSCRRPPGNSAEVHT